MVSLSKELTFVTRELAFSLTLYNLCFFIQTTQIVDTHDCFIVLVHVVVNRLTGVNRFGVDQVDLFSNGVMCGKDVVDILCMDIDD